VARPAEIDWRDVDVAILAMKSQDTAEAARALALAAGADLAVVSAQNAVANERILSRWFGRVYGMVVMCPAAHLEPGHVQIHSAPVSGMLDVGRFPSGVDQTTKDIASALESATFHSVPRPDIMRWKYRKLVMNLGNAVQALCGRSKSTDELSEIVAILEEEAARTFKAADIEPVTVEEDRARRADHLKIQPVGEQPRAGGSTWQSLQRGTGAVETDYLNGEIALLGRLHDVPAPANALLQRLANEAARDRRPPGSMSHADLLDALRGVA
jgi:2-dehydropantoate 2-reductase